MTKLELVYTPGIIAVLRQEPCPGQPTRSPMARQHGLCCNGQHHILKIVSVSIQPDDEPLRLQQCKLKVPT